MDNKTLISEMQKFHFGSQILCTDGEDGFLTSLICDPASARIISIGAKQGRLFGKTFFIPFANVLWASSDAVTFNIKQTEFDTLHREGGGALLDARSVIATPAGAKGTLSLVAVHPESSEIAYIVAHHLRPGQDTLLRREFITSITPGAISVSLASTELNALPPYRSDADLQQEVEDRLFDVTSLHIDRKGMDVRVLDGVLYLNGNISAALRGDMAEDQVLGIPGLLEIKNNLVADDTLAADLAMALGRDERTRDLPIGVYPRLGNVRLSGSVHTNAQKVATEEIVRKFPGVRSVNNELTIIPNSDMLHVMAPSESGDEEDKVPGKYIRHTK